MAAESENTALKRSQRQNYGFVEKCETSKELLSFVELK